MYIGDWMGRGAQYWPDNIAVVDADKLDAEQPKQGRFTYAEMNRRAEAVAGWLHSRGIGHGDRVGVVALNGVEVLDIFFACGKLGAIFVPVNWRLHPAELADLVNQTTPAALFFSDEFAQSIAAIQPDCPSIASYIHLEGPGLPTSAPFQTILDAKSPFAIRHSPISEEDIIALLFTGGTTGLPKAAQISYRMIAWNTLNTVIHELNRDDVTLTHTPLFHTGGLLVYTVPLLTLGGTVVLMRKWTPDEMLALIERERVTMFFCVPTQYQMLMGSPKFAETDFSSVRFLTSGGAPLPISLLKQWTAVHPTPFKQGFGMTEFGPGIFSMGPEFAISKAGSIGRPNYFVEARLVDEANLPVPTGEVGELVLRGPSMCSGYFDNPTASAEAVDDEGWFHTGDMARTDADGFYFIVDRKKDMFISGGENVYPAEIEKALYEHPAVHMCAVIGVADVKWGEVGQACVILKPGMSATEAELLDHMQDRLARFKVPKSVVFMAEFPISAAGKILKRELKA
ncbi:MAG: long-chain fatty acid--CoA ligase [Caldilineaceae bacterium]|nr:long-chain fatty acid--CoA ligase [Caldilineaceae bacterium]MBP8108780.1 long-chain fatty acid--CoA ligase [Caldilineaceae bacterium]MBP8122079.1 long-chain fatty acid--CoA ligase [Caldilineaceae bacterium]MBP9072534.1 long-chain fatty acid--CoA ligase [Caldilineaceae bacterium]